MGGQTARRHGWRWSARQPLRLREKKKGSAPSFCRIKTPRGTLNVPTRPALCVKKEPPHDRSRHPRWQRSQEAPAASNRTVWMRSLFTFGRAFKPHSGCGELKRTRPSPSDPDREGEPDQAARRFGEEADLRSRIRQEVSELIIAEVIQPHKQQQNIVGCVPDLQYPT